MRLSLSNFRIVIQGEGVIVTNNVVSGVNERITEHGVSAFGHSRTAGVEITRLNHGWIETSISQEFARG